MPANTVGSDQPHLPVLYQEIIHAIRPESPGRYIDGTVGAGGHAWGVLDASQPDGQLLGLDVDPQALVLSRQRLSVFDTRATLVQASYTAMDKVMSQIGWKAVQGIILDLGVSSMQLDTPERGFSFKVDGPLDMRFNPDQPVCAASLVNNLPESELARLIWEYGEEPQSRKIARAIVQARPIVTTRQLADVVARAAGSHHGKIHPATRTFQSLRIAVNDELQSIRSALPTAVAALAPGGRLAVIAFHSLEDRQVKQFFQRESRNCICPSDQPVCSCNHRASLILTTRHAVKASAEEIVYNARSRSARLRVAEKI
jgi:16S rRNA (cytosine1402-N4)-methyltransferase